MDQVLSRSQNTRTTLSRGEQKSSCISNKTSKNSYKRPKSSKLSKSTLTSLTSLFPSTVRLLISSSPSGPDPRAKSLMKSTKDFLSSSQMELIVTSINYTSLLMFLSPSRPSYTSPKITVKSLDYLKNVDRSVSTPKRSSSKRTARRSCYPTS